VELDKLTWPEVEAEIARGRDTVVVAFGATEQHGRHLPLATDALIGDRFARLLAERLDALVAPTLRIGCSAHHADFPGTLSLDDETFHAVVADVIRSLVRSGFARIVLIPTHGGNFAPLAAAVEKVGEVAGARVVALTDLTVLFRVAQVGADEHGVPLAEGGVHAGEWETSMLLASAPELVKMDRAEPGFTGPLEKAVQGMFAGGVKSISANGTVGDPAQASAEHGHRYWTVAVELALEMIEAQS
jgi:creatinine amidohydrolase